MTEKLDNTAKPEITDEPKVRFDTRVICTCGANEGCSIKCDIYEHPMYIALEEARDLPPSSREQTLNWILDRSAVIAKKRLNIYGERI